MIILTEEQFKEMIEAAHRAGQHNQGHCDPSAYEAMVYYEREVKKLNIPVVSHSFTLNEIGDKCQKWLDEEIAKDPKDQFSNREKYWMHEAYTAGFNEAIKNCG